MMNEEIDSLNLSIRVETVRDISKEVWDFYKDWVTPYQSIEDIEGFDRCYFNSSVKQLRKKYENNMFAQRLIDVFVLELRGN